LIAEKFLWQTGKEVPKMEQLKTGPQEPFIMPGPKFGESNGWWLRWRKNRSNIILTVIGVLIIIGGVYLYSNYQKSASLISLEQEASQEQGLVKPEQININGQQAQAGETTAGSTQKTTQETNKAELVKNESGKLTMKANKGAGVTHLARQALKEYINLHPELKQNLTPEHKIYIEDYLKDKTGSFPLKINQELSFDEGLIKEAIDSSQKLTQKQLEDLHKYVLLVPSLTT